MKILEASKGSSLESFLCSISLTQTPVGDLLSTENMDASYYNETNGLNILISHYKNSNLIPKDPELKLIL